MKIDINSILDYSVYDFGKRISATFTSRVLFWIDELNIEGLYEKFECFIDTPSNVLKKIKLKSEKIEVFINECETMELEIFNNSAGNECFMIIGEYGQRVELLYFTFMRLKIILKPAIGPLYESLAADLTRSGQAELITLEAHLESLNLIKKDGTFYAPFSGLIQSSGFGKSKLCLDLIQKRPGIYLVFRDQGETGIPDMAGWMRAFTQFVLDAPTDELPLKSQMELEDASKSTPGRFLLALKIILDSYFAMLRLECEALAQSGQVMRITFLSKLTFYLFLDTREE